MAEITPYPFTERSIAVSNQCALTNILEPSVGGGMQPPPPPPPPPPPTLTTHLSALLFQWNFNQYSNTFNQEKALENGVCEMAFILSRPQCVNKWITCFNKESLTNGALNRLNEWTLFAWCLSNYKISIKCTNAVKVRSLLFHFISSKRCLSRTRCDTMIRRYLNCGQTRLRKAVAMIFFVKFWNSNWISLVQLTPCIIDKAGTMVSVDNICKWLFAIQWPIDFFHWSSIEVICISNRWHISLQIQHASKACMNETQKYTKKPQYNTNKQSVLLRGNLTNIK